MSSPRPPSASACPVGSPLRMKHLRSKVSARSKASTVPIRKDSKECNHIYAPGHTLQLTDKKKTALLRLKKREEMRAVRHRLRGILIQKLVLKLGKRKETIITKHVDEFVKDKQTLRAQDLVDLEKAIRADKSMTTPSSTPRGSTMPSLNQQGEPQTDVEPLLGGGRKGPCPQCGKMDCKFNNCKPLPVGTEWEALQTYQALEAAKREEEKERARALKQKELRRYLDDQIRDAQDRRNRERNDDTEYINHVNRDVEKFKADNQAAHEKLMRQQAETKKIWEDQLEAERKAREAHRAMLIREEQADAARAAAALQREKDLIEQKKRAEAAAHQAILKENELNNQRKAEDIRKEHAMDRKLAKDYADRLDREEKARQEAFNKRLANLEKFAKWADEGPAGKGRREEERRVEELLLKEQLLKEERDKKREDDDKRAMLERQRLMTEQNLKLIAERERLAAEEREKDKEYAEKYKEIGDAHRQAERDRRRAQQNQQKRYGSALKDQMQSTRKAEMETMTATERSINKDALNTIQFDPVFHSRVHHRLRMRRPHTAGASRPGTASSGSNSARNNGQHQAWA